MRLAPFIFANTEAILAGWEAFARTLLPGATMNSLALRDHAADLLLATVRDMESVQSAAQLTDRSTGYSDGSALSIRLNGAPEEHAIGRLNSGFDLLQLVAEYRALRISVLSLWRKSLPVADMHDVDDLSLFHESIDQSMAKAVAGYSKRVDESRDMFLAILSHDLRNPLNAISMSAYLLPTLGPPAPETAEYAGKITRSVKVMGRMISDLLDYTRTRLGAGMPVSRVPMDLGALCYEVIAEFRAAMPDAKLHFIATGDLVGEWDTDRLRQVLSNLIGNAFQHGDPNTPVELKVDGQSTDVCITVTNQGKPIAPGELAKIFDPLIRGAAAEQPKANRPGSIGLGLYIAKELVTAHGGTIAVTSTVTGGTVFTVHLPYHPPGELPDAQPGASLTPT